VGKCSIPFTRNNIPFAEAFPFYLNEALDASDAAWFDPSERPPFATLTEVEEFDNGCYLFRFHGGHFFTVQGKTKHWVQPVNQPEFASKPPKLGRFSLKRRVS
jgi:hypothetical protein